MDGSTEITSVGMIQGFLFGALGGFIAEFLGWYKIRKNLGHRSNAYLREFGYWVLVVIMCILGGGAVVLYLHGGQTLNAYLAIHVGLVTPLVLERLTGSLTNAPSPGETD